MTNQKFSAKRLTALILAAVMTLFALPQISLLSYAEDDEKQVRVIVENTTFTEPVDDVDITPAWTGTLLDTWVTLEDSDNAITVIAKAITAKGTTQTGAESNYITEIGGLSAYDGGWMSGWMGTLNDWFTDEGLNAYTVANGKLADGDEIRMMYSMDWGADLGYDWSGEDTSLKAINTDVGTLSPEFSSSVYEYTLTVPYGTSEITFRPEALNKAFQVKTTLAGNEVKRSRPLAISDSDIFTVTVDGKTSYKVTVKEDEKPAPRFESVAFPTYAVSDWDNDTSFDPEVFEYDVNIKTYSTSTLSFTSATRYNSDLLTAYAEYTDINGVKQKIEIKSGSYSYLYNIPFGKTKVTVTLEYKDDAAVKTEYVFNVSRPYDYTAEIAATSGIVLVPGGRELLTAKYNGYAEGTVLRNDEDGNVTDTTGTNAACKSYTAYLLDNPDSFALTLKGKTANVHFRTAVGDETPEEILSSGTTRQYAFGEKDSLTVKIEAVSDGDYNESGFTDAEKIQTYYITVIRADAKTDSTQITEAVYDYGDFYPAFAPDSYTYSIVIENDAEYPEIAFKVTDGSTVVSGSEELSADEGGYYHITAKNTATTVKLTNGSIENTYSFKAVKKSAHAVPDKVVDYLCINSQYTNGSYGIQPEVTLSGSIKSLGNFGGYITYYYEQPVTDNPNNLYGVDFYVYGNSFANGGSAAESAQVYVSEDGESWYALAGSEHFEDSTITDYEITYTKTKSGKTAWTDNQGNSNDGSSNSGKWVSPSAYYMNDLAKGDSITLRGVLIPSIQGTVTGDGTTASFVGETKFGYADYFKNGTIGADVNPYAESAASNGFDLKWAVDENGNPVTFENGIHYIKVATVSNIWAGAFGEKSPEISYLVKTTAQDDNTGVSQFPTVKITGADNAVLQTIENPEDGKVYEVKTGPEEKVAISLDGALEDDNIYVNNQRIAYNESAEIAINTLNEKTVRIIVQNGDKQPCYVYLKLVSDDILSAEQTDSLISKIGTVTLDSGEAIDKALAAYDSLSDNAKSLVTKYDILTAAKAEYDRLAQEKELADKNAVDNVIALIDNAAQAMTEESLTAARQAYNALPDELKENVTNYAALTAAEARFAEIADIKQSGENSAKNYELTAEKLTNSTIYPLFDIGGEWTLFGLARAGKLSDEKAEEYYSALVNAIDELGSETLSRKATDNARVALALCSIDKNPADVNGYDLLKPLCDKDFVTKQGINGVIFALIALDCTDYETDMRDEYVDYLVNNMTGGGWALAGDKADPDVTAMALQALAPYCDSEKVKTSVDAALDTLSGMLDENCRFKSGCEGTAQAIIAICSLGINPGEDARFIKDGITLIDALNSYYGESGFCHVLGGEENMMATEQAFMALTALNRLADGKSALYDMEVKTAADNENNGGDTSEDNSSNTSDDNSTSEDNGNSDNDSTASDTDSSGENSTPDNSDTSEENSAPDSDSSDISPDDNTNPATGVMLGGTGALAALALLGAAFVIRKRK